MYRKLYIFILILLFFNLMSCKKDPIPFPGDQEENEMINEWIWELMNLYYYWAGDINQSLYPTSETNPERFFYSILSEEDRFSWIVDDYQALLNSFDNIHFTNGISPLFVKYNANGDVAAIVEYVSKDTPADSAGIQRGEMITMVNGNNLTVDNYMMFYVGGNVTYGFANYTDSGFELNGKSVHLAAKEIEENPIVHYEIIEFGGKKIGYIAYTLFSDGKNGKWLDSLDMVFTDFKLSGINDMIFDLRYNPGGYGDVARHIAGILLPSSVAGGENVFVRYQYNEMYTEYLQHEFGENSSWFAEYFDEIAANNLDLQTVYFLTGQHSASASELTIIGLDPYMNVVQVGDTTYGKF